MHLFYTEKFQYVVKKDVDNSVVIGKKCATLLWNELHDYLDTWFPLMPKIPFLALPDFLSSAAGTASLQVFVVSNYG